MFKRKGLGLGQSLTGNHRNLHRWASANPIESQIWNLIRGPADQRTFDLAALLLPPRPQSLNFRVKDLIARQHQFYATARIKIIRHPAQISQTLGKTSIGHQSTAQLDPALRHSVHKHDTICRKQKGKGRFHAPILPNPGAINQPKLRAALP